MTAHFKEQPKSKGICGDDYEPRFHPEAQCKEGKQLCDHNAVLKEQMWTVLNNPELTRREMHQKLFEIAEMHRVSSQLRRSFTIFEGDF